MSRWLPPGGGGYSGRSASSGRNGTMSTVARKAATAAESVTTDGSGNGKTTRSTIAGRYVKVTPMGKGSAGVSRAK